jgi:DNA-binding HxlR family transcriptional regulator
VAGTYDQYCAVATALDVVGDRWTLLIVRELLAGPRRYNDLREDLPGVATNLLADRLRRLEADGIVGQVPASDARARTYALTDDGLALRPVLESLALFGLPRLAAAPGAERPFRAHWLEIPVGALLRYGALDEDLVVRFEVAGAAGTDVLQLRLTTDGASVAAAAEPDVVVRGGPAALVHAVRDPSSSGSLLRSGRLSVSGGPDDLRRLAAALGVDRPQRPPGRRP